MEYIDDIIRVFPRRTRATPNDFLAYTGPPDLFTPRVRAVHVSVAFSADKIIAEKLAEQWREKADVVEVSGPAYGVRSEEFVPGKYIKPGYTITSRGCPRTCWFCDVWKRENDRPRASPRELPIVPGNVILDDNLLACSRPHVEAVFQMLRQQKGRCEFVGGLEALSLQDYQVGLLTDLKPKPKCYFAYDPGDAFETLREAARRLFSAGFRKTSHNMMCYVLIGYPKDTFPLAERRLQSILDLGFTPFAMLWQPSIPVEAKWKPPSEWKKFQRQWVRPAIIHRRKIDGSLPTFFGVL